VRGGLVPYIRHGQRLWWVDRRFVVHRLSTHQGLFVFLPARAVQEVARERGCVVGTAVFGAWGAAVNGVCVDVALLSFLDVRCAGAADWTAIHAAMIVVTNPGKRNATSAVKKYEDSDVKELSLKFCGKHTAHILTSAPVATSIVPTEISAVGMVSRENQVMAPALREKMSAPVSTERSIPVGNTRMVPAIKPAMMLQISAVKRRIPLAP